MNRNNGSAGAKGTDRAVRFLVSTLLMRIMKTIAGMGQAVRGMMKVPVNQRMKNRHESDNGDRHEV
jgi:hypothetical protein